MGKTRIYGSLLAGSAILLLPPHAALAKERDSSGWTCSIQSASGRYYWFLDEAGKLEGNSLYRDSKAGQFVLTTRFKADNAVAAGRAMPVMLQVHWDHPDGRTFAAARHRIELTDGIATRWEDPFEASPWFMGNSDDETDLALSWASVKDWSAAYPGLVLTVRDPNNGIADSQPVPDGVLSTSPEEVRNALLQMARLSADFRNSKACEHQEIEWIVVG